MAWLKYGVLVIVIVALLQPRHIAHGQTKAVRRPQVLANGSFRSQHQLLWFSPDGRSLYVLDWLGGVSNWDLARNTVSEPIETECVVDVKAIASDSSLIACANDSTVLLWDTRGKKAVWRKKSVPGTITSMAFSQDNNCLAVGNSLGTVFLFRCKTGVMLPVTLQGDEGSAYHIAFSKNGKRLCFAVERKLQCFELSTGKRIGAKCVDKSRDIYMTFSPDESHLLVGCRIMGPKRRIKEIPFAVGRKILGGELQIWDSALLKPARRTGVGGDTLTHIVCSPNKKFFASCRHDGAVTLWRVKDFKRIAHFEDNRDWPRCIAFAPDGRKLVVGYRDNRIFIWDIQHILSARGARLQ